jgi:hypothetical protein
MADEHTRELCQAAIAADRMNFETHFGDHRQLGHQAAA